MSVLQSVRARAARPPRTRGGAGRPRGPTLRRCHRQRDNGLDSAKYSAAAAAEYYSATAGLLVVGNARRLEAGAARDACALVHHCQRRRRLAWQGFAVCSAKMGALQMDAVGRQRASFNKVDVLAATRVERRDQHLASP